MCLCANTLPSNLLLVVLSYGGWGLSWHFMRINLRAFKLKLLNYFMRQSFLPRNALAESGTIKERLWLVEKIMFISKDIVFSPPVIFHFKVVELLNKFMDLKCY